MKSRVDGLSRQETLWRWLREQRRSMLISDVVDHFGWTRHASLTAFRRLLAQGCVTREQVLVAGHYAMRYRAARIKPEDRRGRTEGTRLGSKRMQARRMTKKRRAIIENPWAQLFGAGR